MTLWLWLRLAACWQGDVYIVEGTVVSVGSGEVTLDHDPIEGLMGAMIMSFPVADPDLLQGLAPGDRVVARYELTEARGRLVRLRVTGHGPPPKLASGQTGGDAPVPVRVGEIFPETTLSLHDGSRLVLGPSQADRVALTFIYTRCPQPEFCPAMIARLQSLQSALGALPAEGSPPRIVAVTLDPEHDTPSVLAEHAAAVGAGERWSFARAADNDALAALSMRAGLSVLRPDETAPGAVPEIAHGLRLLVLDRGGALVERYDDARFPQDRVVSQLSTGTPAGDPSNSGTISP